MARSKEAPAGRLHRGYRGGSEESVADMTPPRPVLSNTSEVLRKLSWNDDWWLLDESVVDWEDGLR